KLEGGMEGRHLQHADQPHALEQAVGQVGKIVELVEIVERVRQDQQGRIQLVGVGLRQEQQLVFQVGQHAFGIGGVAGRVAYLVFHLHRLGEIGRAHV